MANDRSNEKIGSWKNRRRFMWIISIFCMYCIDYVMRFGADSRVNDTIIMAAFFCLASIVGAYVFGAAWQDINFKQAKTKKEV